VDFFSIVNKLKFEIMHHHHHAHPSFEVLATLGGMKTSGNTARHNTPVRIELRQQKRFLPIVLFLLLLLCVYVCAPFGKLEEACWPIRNEGNPGEGIQCVCV
jgi:hypothetical protein